MQNAFKNLSYGLQFCPLMKLSNTLKKLEYVPWSKNPWPLQGSGTSQKLCFQKVYNSISQLVYLDQKTLMVKAVIVPLGLITCGVFSCLW